MTFIQGPSFIGGYWVVSKVVSKLRILFISFWNVTRSRHAGFMIVHFVSGVGVKMEHFQAALDPRKQELLEARFLGAKVRILTLN